MKALKLFSANAEVMRAIHLFLWGGFFQLLSWSAEPTYQLSEKSLQVNLGNGTSLEFALYQGWLLGLSQPRVGGHLLSDPSTVQRPLVAQEYLVPGIWPFMKFRTAEVVEGAVHIHVDLLGGTEEKLFREEFVFAPDKRRALGEMITPELAALRDQAQRAREILDPLVESDPSLGRIRGQLQRELTRKQQINPEMTWEVIDNRMRIERFQNRLVEAREALYEKAAQTPEQRRAWQTIQDFNRLWDKRAMEVASIHRDFYAFAHLRLPAESCRIESLIARIQTHRNALRPGGRLVWILRPVERNIAGWLWRGWAQHFEVSLHEDHQVNNLRMVGTWELGGSVDGLTLVALRYRGLGGVEETIQVDAQHGGARRAWSTTEILAGAAGRPPAVSPVIPPVADETLEDRGFAMRHRLGAWISKPARGAGAPFVDFQSRGGLTLISSFDSQGALRAVTEIFPGDRNVSQIDEQWFANAKHFQTKPQLYLVLEHPDAVHERITRWQEVDQYFRDVVARAMDLHTIEPLPGVGWLDEYTRAQRYQGLADGGMARMIANGVRMMVTHTPGWFSEQYPDGPHQPAGRIGNSNRVFDWVIGDDVRPGWKGMREIMQKHGVLFFIYLGGMVRPDGPFARQIGTYPQLWGMNQPDSGYSHGYPPLLGHNVRHHPTRELLTRRLLTVREELGMDGIWCDSFQNMFMSQLTWGDGSGAPMQEAWWPLLAEWSRQGIYFMSESHAFPGLSCSIELQGWEEAYFYFQHVWKWLRGASQRDYSPEQLDRMAFRFMANKSAIAPDWSFEVIPSFRRYSSEYMAALPSMRRSWVLPDDAGVLWLPYDRDDQGVWFSFRSRRVPEGVRATPILGGSPVAEVRSHQTYAVQGSRLHQSFGVHLPPYEDPRKQKIYRPNFPSGEGPRIFGK